MKIDTIAMDIFLTQLGEYLDQRHIARLQDMNYGPDNPGPSGNRWGNFLAELLEDAMEDDA